MPCDCRRLAAWPSGDAVFWQLGQVGKSDSDPERGGGIALKMIVSALRALVGHGSMIQRFVRLG